MDEKTNFSLQTFYENLKALEQTAPLLAERLRLPVDEGRIRPEANGLSLRVNQSWISLAVEHSEIERFRAKAQEPGKPLLLFGVGDGSMLSDLLSVPIRRPIIAWEKDPLTLKTVLMRQSFASLIHNQQLVFSLGIDILDFIHNDSEFDSYFHPVAKKLYPAEALLLERGMKDRRVVVEAEGLLAFDVLQHFLSEGFSAYTVNFEAVAAEEIEYTLAKFKPDLVFAFNYRNGLAELTHKHRLLCVCWEIDPTIDRVSAPASSTEHVHIFHYRKAGLKDFQNAGFDHVTYLPMAANPALRKPTALSPDELGRYSSNISFIGSSLIQQASEYRQKLIHLFQIVYGDQARGEKLLEEILSIQRQNPFSYVIPELAACYFKKIYNVGVQHLGFNPVDAVAEIAAAEKRVNLIHTAATVQPVKVWGDPGWKHVAAERVVYMGYAGHFQELNKIYSASRINLDINRIYQADIVPLRIFEILACKGFVLAEYNSAFEELFDVNKEIAVYSDINDLQEKLRYYLEHPKEAQTIAERGYQAIMERHQLRFRINHILRTVERTREVCGCLLSSRH